MANARLASLVLASVGVAVMLVALDPLGHAATSAGAVAAGSPETSLQRIQEQPLSSQTEVNGILGYAGAWTIRVPPGATPARVAQTRRALSVARLTLAVARSRLVADRAVLADARTERVNDGGAETAAAAKVTEDEDRVVMATHRLADARAALRGARADETAYGQQSVYTALPAPGRVVERGQQLYAIDGRPVVLFYGRTLAVRAFVGGMTPGEDVAELNRNLDALGDGRGLTGDSFTAATTDAIRALQRAERIKATGRLPLGSVAFEPGPVRAIGIARSIGVGATVSPGPLLSVSSTRRVVMIALSTSLEGQVRIDDPVIITLPDNTTTAGRVSSIGKVATAGQNGSSVLVQAIPSDARATGALDQAPVGVQITTQSVHDALVVPVDALVALAGGADAVEEATHGVHHLVTVHTGLFDDADELVQVTGRGLAAGQQVVVPGA